MLRLRAAPLLKVVLATVSFGSSEVLSQGRTHPETWASHEMFEEIEDTLKRDIRAGFPKRTPPGSLLKALAQLNDVKDPCDAQILAKGLAHTAGFGSRVNGFWDELMVALYGGFTFSVCDHVDHKYFPGRVWSQYFEAAPFRVCNSTAACSSSPQRPAQGLSELGRQLRHCLADPASGMRGYLLKIREVIARHAFVLKRPTRARIDSVLDGAGVGANSTYIGVHIRHGDKFREAELIPTEVYGDVVRNHSEASAISREEKHEIEAQDEWKKQKKRQQPLEVDVRDVSMRGSRRHQNPEFSGNTAPSPVRLDEHAASAQAPPDASVFERYDNGPVAEVTLRERMKSTAQAIRIAAQGGKINKVYIASDDPDAWQELQSQLRSEFTLVQQPPPPDEVYRDREYASEEAAMALLTDIVALQRSELFIGTGSSNVDMMLYYLRHGLNSISLDEDGDMMGSHDRCLVSRPRRSDLP